MNFLAHFHLAWPDKGLLLGGLEGDYIKGPLRGALPKDLERGIKLHRAIDAYTDGHPLLLQLRRELPPSLRRYAGIRIDLSFDHVLSRHWSQYSDIPNLYMKWESVLATATRIGHKFRHPNPFLENLDRELSPAQDNLEQAFLNFYSQLQSFCKQRIGLLSLP